MKKIPIAILLILLVRAFFIINQNKEVIVVEEPETIIQEEVATDSAKVTEDMIYSIEEIANHTTPEDCWFAINKTVYDVSNFATHPGEEVIYEGCGTDATNLFETRPMGSGTPHSDEAREQLASFEVGVLATE